MSEGRRVLIVDDDRSILRALEYAFTRAGYRARGAGSADEAMMELAISHPDVILLDLVLGDDDGVDLCREIRSRSAAPIIVLSVVDDEAEKVRALDSGADDFVVKPFGLDELLARVRVALRRGESGGAEADAIAYAGITIDWAGNAARYGDADLHLTPTELRLLAELVRGKGRVITHGTILQRVWGVGYADHTAVLRVHIARLRDKLEQAGGSRSAIETAAGVGYRLADVDG